MNAETAGIATTAAPARKRAALGLSGRLLLLTVLFVMIAEVLIFVPSAANFRTMWMEERLEAARLAALAVEAAPDRSVNNQLAGELLSRAGVSAVAVKRDGMRELVLNAAPEGAAAEFTVDLRTLSRAGAMVQVWGAFFPEPGAHMRIMGEPHSPQAEFIEALAPQAPLARELRAYSGRIFAASIIISLITATLIYVTLNIALVRPIRRMTASITAFRDAPDRAAPPREGAGRYDEVGEAQTALAEMQAGLSQTLRQKQRLAELGEAVARINHDLRNALSSASLVSDRLSGDEDPRVREFGARIFRSVDRASRLCDATLRYGADSQAWPQPRVMDLRAELEDAAADALDGARAAVWENSAPDQLAVLCDPEHMHRIALNLIRNAAAAIPDEGGRITVSAARAGRAVTVRIADNGPGVPEAAMARLFQPFASGAKGGTGLGLAISRDLARANGGDLRLAETGTGGAVFELELLAG